ncbi:DedA family protein [Camelliibacillus cellulosilyticus]|uniref:DedA family protein n=1 Tax=Camelliibacillus cellulosilyticus TaxID=2174486 RepID=UPI003670FF54
MFHHLLEWISGLGMIGLFITMFLEGASVPFPGIIVVLAYGYVMNLSLLEIILLALAMSAFYSLASMIPYILAYKLEVMIPKRIKKGLDKAKTWFKKYGEWSIAFTRPFGVGNYISFVAGIAKVHPVRFICLTFIGIFPWALGILLVGNDTIPAIQRLL